MRNKLVLFSIVSIVIAALLLMPILFVSRIAYAGDSVVYINNIDILSEPIEGVSFDEDTNTLTLNNYVNNAMRGYIIPNDDNFAGIAGIYLGQVTTIKLIGKSSITLEDGENACVGIFSPHSLTFCGDGELSISVGKTKAKANFGIFANNITFTETAKVNALVRVGDNGSEGIHSEGIVTINGAKVSSIVSTATGLNATRLEVKSGSINIDAGKGTGIAVAKLIVTGGGVNIVGNTIIDANEINVDSKAVIVNKDPEGIDWTQDDIKYPLGIGFPIKLDAVDPICEVEGNIECYCIPELDRYFSDEDCTLELDKKDVFIKALEHDYGKVTYTWNGSKCTASRTCLKCTHVEQETIESVYSVLKEPTCITTGVCQYEATFINTEFDTSSQQNPIPAKGHNYKPWVDEVDSTLEQEGIFGHQHCISCNRNFDKNDKEMLSIVKPKKVLSSESSNKLVSISADGGVDSFLIVEASELSIDDPSIVNALKTSKKYDKEVFYAFDVSLKDDGVEVQPNGKISITINMASQMEGKQFVLVHIHEGKVEEIKYSIDDGKITFEVDKLSGFAFVDLPIDVLPVWAICLIIGLSLAIIIAAIIIIEVTPRGLKEEEFSLTDKE